MKQLSGVDASFLYMESETNFGHVTGLSIYERPDEAFEPLVAVRATYEAMVGELEPLRNRLIEVPFGIDHPYWIADPNFDLDYHVRALNVAAPGRIDQLAEQVSRLHGRALDRTRPLWETYVIDGLADDHWAIVTKVHHAAIDGAAGQRLLSALTNTDPDARPAALGATWNTEPIPSDAEMVARGVSNLLMNPIKAAAVHARLAGEVAQRIGLNSSGGYPFDLSSGAGEGAPASVKSRGLPPATLWNKSITQHRRFAMANASVENIKRLKNAVGATVNDVVLAICAGALREYLILHDALPAEPLRAMVPVSIRSGTDTERWANKVSAIFADLPTDCDDPLERVRRCRDAMIAAKRQHELVPADALADLSQFSSPVLAASANRLASQLRIADHVRPPANLVISNVPGSRQPLYLSGARLLHQFPVSIVTDGQGLNITVQSYLDSLDFGFVADRELVPDLWTLADLHVAEIAKLFDATGAQWAFPPTTSAFGPEARSHSRPAAKTSPAKAARRATTSAKRSASGRTPGKPTPRASAEPATDQPPARRRSPALLPARTTNAATADGRTLTPETPERTRARSAPSTASKASQTGKLAAETQQPRRSQARSGATPRPAAATPESSASGKRAIEAEPTAAAPRRRVGSRQPAATPAEAPTS